jgi:hypothetical protein
MALQALLLVDACCASGYYLRSGSWGRARWDRGIKNVRQRQPPQPKSPHPQAVVDLCKYRSLRQASLLAHVRMSSAPAEQRAARLKRQRPPTDEPNLNNQLLLAAALLLPFLLSIQGADALFQRPPQGTPTRALRPLRPLAWPAGSGHDPARALWRAYSAADFWSEQKDQGWRADERARRVAPAAPQQHRSHTDFGVHTSAVLFVLDPSCCLAPGRVWLPRTASDGAAASSAPPELIVLLLLRAQLSSLPRALERELSRRSRRHDGGRAFVGRTKRSIFAKAFLIHSRRPH